MGWAPALRVAPGPWFRPGPGQSPVGFTMFASTGSRQTIACSLDMTCCWCSSQTWSGIVHPPVLPTNIAPNQRTGPCSRMAAQSSGASAGLHSGPPPGHQPAPIPEYDSWLMTQT